MIHPMMRCPAGESMAESGSPATPPLRRSQRRLIKTLAIVAGVGFIAWELHTLIPSVRIAAVQALGALGPAATTRVLGYFRDDSIHVR